MTTMSGKWSKAKLICHSNGEKPPRLPIKQTNILINKEKLKLALNSQ